MHKRNTCVFLCKFVFHRAHLFFWESLSEYIHNLGGLFHLSEFVTGAVAAATSALIMLRRDHSFDCSGCDPGDVPYPRASATPSCLAARAGTWWCSRPLPGSEAPSPSSICSVTKGLPTSHLSQLNWSSFSRSVLSNSFWPHALQPARPPCPSPSPRVCSSSCPSSRWCHPIISSSGILFSSCPQCFSASGSFPTDYTSV